MEEIFICLFCRRQYEEDEIADHINATEHVFYVDDIEDGRKYRNFLLLTGVNVLLSKFSNEIQILTLCKINHYGRTINFTILQAMVISK